MNPRCKKILITGGMQWDVSDNSVCKNKIYEAAEIMGGLDGVIVDGGDRNTCL